jgi:hypothetical protein
MSGDGARFEYPDEAGYPDGMGVLHEGTEDAGDAARDPDASGAGDAADGVEHDLDHFAMEDEEDDDEGV